MRSRWLGLLLSAWVVNATACSLVVDTSVYRGPGPETDADVDAGEFDGGDGGESDGGDGGESDGGDGGDSAVVARHEGESCDATMLCEGALVCEPAVAGGSICGVPFIVAGRAVDAASGLGVANATVLLIDEQELAVTDLVTTAADGRFEVTLSVARGAGGIPSDASKPTLRIDATAYASHPNLIEDALVVVPSTAARAVDSTSYKTPESDVTARLVPYNPGGTVHTISGRVTATTASGQLIVAHGTASMRPTALSDRDGDFVLFNVPAGMHDVQAYRVGSSGTPLSVDVSSADATGVSLVTTTTTGSVSGTILFVSSPFPASVTMRLAVADGFVGAFLRGPFVPGVAVSTSGSYSLTGVPFGDFVVVASDDNDGVIADPDTSLGSSYPQVSIASSSNVMLGGTIRITPAVHLIDPAGPTTMQMGVTSPFRWTDVSGEQAYVVQIYDATGIQKFQSAALPPGSGEDQLYQYTGGSLVTGLPYRVNVLALKNGAVIDVVEQRLGRVIRGP